LTGSKDRHHLQKFIRETFGEQFGALLLAGYGDSGRHRALSLHVTESRGGGDQAGLVVEIAGTLPHGQEPLVLAALLKLLLARPGHGPRLEFTTEELLGELGWRGSAVERDAVDGAIRKYTKLSYVKKRADTGEVRGMYALVVDYEYEAEVDKESGDEARSRNRVVFQPHFVERLNELKITFAGIEFGDLNSIEFIAPVVPPVM
jgi:hypothetical protein